MYLFLGLKSGGTHALGYFAWYSLMTHAHLCSIAPLLPEKYLPVTPRLNKYNAFLFKYRRLPCSSRKSILLP